MAKRPALSRRLRCWASVRVFEKARRDDAQHLFGGFDEGGRLEAALDLRPVVPELPAEAAGVEVEALVQQDDEEQVGPAAAEGPFRELLQQEDARPSLPGLVLKELAEFVDE